METMSGRVAVVTGAASGIGKALALGFAAEGANVVLADIEQTALDAATEEINAACVGEASALGVQTDVSDADSVGALADATLSHFGAVHILCNNAGVGGGGLIRNQQLVDYKWVIDVCLWGVIHGVHHFLPHLLEADESHLMSTASVAGLIPTVGLGPYNAAKYGVVGLMETLHLEMERDKNSNLGVSVLCPGVVRTNIASAQRNRPESLKRTRKPESASGAGDAVAGSAASNAGGAASDSEGSSGQSSDRARDRNARIAALLEKGMDPAQVAALVIDAMYQRRFWVLSHPELLADINHRNEQLSRLENPTIYSSFAD